ncbi:hypothetical protein CRENBAI_024586 [Crenichthys baileyi]|uniref:Uncharacterized protein n=1 Tax=Crenichthys baileyi TaxID=28760 RepID=A0AAV9QS76_9TELE
MLTSSDQSLSLSLTPTLHSPRCGHTHVQSSLSLPEPEDLKTSIPTARPGLAQGARSCSLQVPHAGLENLGLPPRAASFDVPYSQDDGSSDQGSGSLSPHAALRRRGGLVEQKDIIMAHQAHKIQSTPQARRKEWEMARFGDESAPATVDSGDGDLERGGDGQDAASGGLTASMKQAKAQRARTMALYNPVPHRQNCLTVNSSVPRLISSAAPLAAISTHLSSCLTPPPVQRASLLQLPNHMLTVGVWESGEWSALAGH